MGLYSGAATTDAGPMWPGDHFRAATADMTGTVSICAAPSSGQKRVLLDIVLANRHSASMEFTIQEETTATVVHGPWPVPSGQAVQFTTRGKMSKLDTADKRYQVVASVAGTAEVETWTFSEA